MAGIYIHIPFCRKKCHYCDFYRVNDPGFSNNSTIVDSYLEALRKEIVLRRDYTKGEEIESIYIGGGTPSLLDAGQVRSLTSTIGDMHKVASGCEITMEANPDDISREYLMQLKEKTPVNRLSLGIQSFFDDDLEFLNRRHNAETAFSVIEECIGAGYDNLSIDLIYGIPRMTPEKWERNVNYATGTRAAHISAYHLTIEPRTQLYKMVTEGKVVPAGEDQSREQYDILCRSMQNAGYTHYEISNFCRDGLISRHNTNYWRQKIYLGLGPSAHSFDLESRQWNLRGIGKYIRTVNEGMPAFGREETDDVRRYNEYLMLSLRTIAGISLDHIESSFGKDYASAFSGKAPAFIGSGQLKREGDRFFLTEDSWFISDHIISSFFM